jgi:adenylate kinase
MKKPLYCVSGTPGTGKKTISPMAAAMLGVRAVSVDSLARGFGLVSGRGEEREVDVATLSARIGRWRRGPALVYGHLVPHCVPRAVAESVVVLRCDPMALKRRLKARGYPPEKVIENVEAELIGLVAFESRKAFGRKSVFELDTSRTSPERSSIELAEALAGRENPGSEVDWTFSYRSPSKLASLLSPPR